MKSIYSNRRKKEMHENKCMFVLWHDNVRAVKPSIFNLTIHVSFMAPLNEGKVTF